MGYGGNDSLYGEGGHDKMFGDTTDKFAGSGADYLSGGAGSDRFVGGGGYDRFRDDFNLSSPVYNGVSIHDVFQGASNTCAVNAAMTASAKVGINWASKITYVGNNQFDISMYSNGNRYYERVFFDGLWYDGDSQPINANGYRTGDFWSLLGQRAFLESYGVDWSKPTSTWDDATTGWQVAGNAMERLHGWDSNYTQIANASASAMRTAILNNDMVVAASADNATSPITGWHGYTVLDVYKNTSGAWMVQLRNPWGTGGTSGNGVLTISWSTFTANFKGYFIAS
jgi:hypothetical protein